MAKSRRDDNGGENFFGVVSKNCKTVFVEWNIGTVRKKITQRRVTRNNVAIFKCFSNGGKINKELTHRPAFRLLKCHHLVFDYACLDFLKDEMEA